jgi:uncharacterized protein with GYD domain
MAKYMCTAHFTSGSWARLVKGSEDRTAVVRSLMESLGGSLEAIYWGLTATCRLPLSTFRTR